MTTLFCNSIVPPDLPPVTRSMRGPTRTAAVRSRRAYRREEFSEQFAQMAAFVKKLRRRKRMSQSVFAVLVGVTKGAVSRWERGYAFPDLPQRKRLAELDATAEATMSDEDKERHDAHE